jgi:SPP1 gp7 family putative phage head morphogenesis protein
MANEGFKQEVSLVNKETLKRAAKNGKLPKRITKPSRFLLPLNIERKYQAQLSNKIKAFNGKIKEILFPLLPGIIEEAAQDRRFDDYLDKIQQAMALLSISSDDNIGTLEDTALIAGSAAADFNETQLRKLTRQALSVDIITDEPWLKNEISLFAQQNVKLIKSIQDKSITDIEGIIQRGIQTGRRHEDIAKEIQKKFRTSRKRAKFIARDQVSKLNGAITKTRQTDLGIDMYIWRTSEDERVRNPHSVLNGKLMRWDNPSVYSKDSGKTWLQRSSIGGYIGIPGEDFNCRCYAEPYFKGFIEQIEK